MSEFRAPFIWTPKQPIAKYPRFAPNALSRSDGLNRWFLFRTRVALENVPAEALTDITVDGRYLLFVNGVQAGRGPVRCSPLAQRFDTYDLASHLKTGDNVIAVLVHTYGVDTAFYEGVKGLWRPAFGDGGLWVEGDVIDTRRSWRCIQSDAWVQDSPQVNHSLGFIEWLDANRLPADWTNLDFDDSSWDIARPLVVGGGGPEASFGGMVLRPFPVLKPRGIPALQETEVRAEAIRWARAQISEPDLPIVSRLYDEALDDLPEGAIEGLEGILSVGGTDVLVRTGLGLDTAFTLDFGRIFSGYPMFEIEAQGGEIIEIGCSERLPNEWIGSVDPEARIRRAPLLGNDAHVCRYVARPGVQRFQRFEWCAIRYMHVVVRNASVGLKIRSLGAVETHYPVEHRGRFSCSDPMLTKLWAAGAYTLQQCMHDAWEDCPSREQRQWLGDVTVENLAAWAAFGSSAAALNAKYLVQAAESQRSDGLTQMFAPGDHHDNSLLIPDWTLQWILCAADHWNLTADLETMDAIWPSIQKALSWFEGVAGPHGLIVDMIYWHFMDWAGLGRSDQALALNAQLAGAYRAAAVVGRAVGAERAAQTYEARATRMTTQLDADHWDEVRGVWVDMVEPRQGVQRPRVSQHGVAALTLWGNPDRDRVARAFAWATDPERETWTAAPPVVPVSGGQPLDEDRGVVMANTFYGHFVGEALSRHGQRQVALANIRRRFEPMIAAGSTTLWEAMTPFASLCHGFSASPTHFLSRHVLGVSPAAPGFERIQFSPDLIDLEHAKGIVPAGDRDLQIFLQRTDLGFDARIEGGGDAVDVVAAPGLVLTALQQSGDQITARFATAPVLAGKP